MLRFALMSLFALVSLPALAQNKTPAVPAPVFVNGIPIDRVLKIIQSRNSECEVELLSVGSLPSSQPATGTGLTFVTYGVTGCGGGNNWSTYAGVFAADNQGNVTRIDLFDNLGLGSIQAIDYGKSNVIISGLGWGDGDVHACPTHGKVIRFINDPDRVRVDVIKLFREPNNCD